MGSSYAVRNTDILSLNINFKHASVAHGDQYQHLHLYLLRLKFPLMDAFRLVFLHGHIVWLNHFDNHAHSDSCLPPPAVCQARLDWKGDAHIVSTRREVLCRQLL